MNNDYRMEIDLENNQVKYIRLDKRHGKTEIISYDDIAKNPDIMNIFSGKDGHAIGTVFTANSLNKISVNYILYNYKYLALISILFVTIMIVSNILSVKLTSIFGHTITGAMLIYPFSYIFDYIITDVYGYQNSRRILLSTIVALILFDISILVVTLIPASPYWHLQKEIEDIFFQMFRTFFASTVAFSVSFFISSYFLQKFKIKNIKDSLFRRIFKSLLISEIFDTGLFCILSFYGKWPMEDMMSFILIFRNFEALFTER